jgi:hypothetical protein
LVSGNIDGHRLDATAGKVLGSVSDAVIALQAQGQSPCIAPDAVEPNLTKIWYRNRGHRGLDAGHRLLRGSMGVCQLMKFLKEI